MVMNFQINVLIFVRSIREGNFEVYIESLRKVIKWYFILDKYHHAHWLTIHLFDLLTLDVKFPEVYTQMQKGFFSFQKSNRELILIKYRSKVIVSLNPVQVQLI